MTKLKPIEKPQFYGAIGIPGFEFDKWFDKYVAPLNALIEGAERIYGGKNTSWTVTNKPTRADTEVAYIVGRQPIRQESCREIVAELILQVGNGKGLTVDQAKLVDRAKAALAREVKK